MLLGYVDDSGEHGMFVLATIVVRDEAWLRTLDVWTSYRRWLRRQFGYRLSKGPKGKIPVEVHASDFVAGSGEWHGRGIGLDARMRAYRVGLRLIGRETRVFAVAWDPSRPGGGSIPKGGIPAECWTVMLERFATHSTYTHGGDRVGMFVDDGYGNQFTKAMRRMRRHHYVGSRFGGSLPAEAPMLIDDPSVRDSRQSAFVQMADLCAYASSP